MRLLGAVRLSKDTDETTSPERQRKLIEKFAADNGHTVVAMPEDLDVSGYKVAPEDRPVLGPWLKRTGEWDAVIRLAPSHAFKYCAPPFTGVRQRP